MVLNVISILSILKLLYYFCNRNPCELCNINKKYHYILTAVLIFGTEIKIYVYTKYITYYIVNEYIIISSVFCVTNTKLILLQYVPYLAYIFILYKCKIHNSYTFYIHL